MNWQQKEKILQLESGDDPNSFKEACYLLQENLSALFITSNVDELEAIFKEHAEIEADEIEVVKIGRPQENEILFSVQGRFTVPVTRAIPNNEIMEKIEDEFEGDFNNGLMVQVPIFEENLDDPSADVNDGEGDTLAFIESHNVFVIEDDWNELESGF